MKWWMVCLSLAVALVWSSSAAAQQMENIKPGPEHAVLKKAVGTWDAEVDMGPMGGKSKGTQVIKEGPGGIWFTTDFKSDMLGLKFEGHGVTGYDPLKKKYVGTWVDSMSGGVSTTEGTYDASSKTMTETMTSVGPDGKPAKMESVIVYKSDDEHTFTMSMVMPDGSKMKVMTITYKRKS
jgi:hypothetical protein